MQNKKEKIASTSLYKSGGLYGVISTKDMYKSGGRYGVVSPKEFI